MKLEKNPFSSSENKLLMFSYTIDVDPITDQKDIYGEHWASLFSDFYSKNRKQQLLYLTIGEMHSLAANSKGQIYQWGATDQFQMGYISSLKINPEPMKADFDRLGPFSMIQTGCYHTLAYSRAQNRLFVWGDNLKGQLGLDHFIPVYKIVELSHLIKPGQNVVQLEAKGSANAITLSDGTSFIWPYVQPDQSVSASPMYASFDRDKVLSVSLGIDFSVFLIDNGTLFAMGSSNEYGELGQGDFLPRYAPTKIKSLVSQGVM
jgi:alpha-tubulin suppressor-like RCC1 family protein